MREIWQDIKGYEGLYKVSNFGQIKSVRSNKILRQYLDKSFGYYSLSLTKDGVQKKARTHRLVAQAFLSNTSGKTQINHIDGSKVNNIATNLEWATAKENTNHARIIGLVKEIGWVSKKITGDDVIIIRKMIEQGKTYEEIKQTYNISIASLHRIKTGKTWKQI